MWCEKRGIDFTAPLTRLPFQPLAHQLITTINDRFDEHKRDLHALLKEAEKPLLDDLAELRLQRESLAFMAARGPFVSESAKTSAPNARGAVRVVELGKQIEHTLASASKTLEESGRRVLKKPQFQCNLAAAMKALSGFGAVVK